MNKKLSLIRENIKKNGLRNLSAEEIRIYFDYRLENVVRNKKAIVFNELEYLMGETGPGNLRINPELLSCLAKEKEFIYAPFYSMQEIKDALKRKKIFASYIEKHKNSSKAQSAIVKVLGNFLKDVEIIGNKPFVIEGLFGSTPIICLIKNGEWILPEKELFLFLKKAKLQNKFPVVIAKKIHGALFPVFKTLSVLGLSTYKTYLPKEGKEMSEIIKPKDELFSDLRYNGQFEFLDDDLLNITDDYWGGEAMKNFFENVLLKNIDVYYGNFLQSKIEIADNFVDTVSQFRKNKVTKSLIENFNRQQEIIANLEDDPV